MLIFVFMTFKWSLDEKVFWKETFDEWNCFIFPKKKKKKKKKKKTPQSILSVKRKQQFSAIQ